MCEQVYILSQPMNLFVNFTLHYLLTKQLLGNMEQTYIKIPGSLTLKSPSNQPFYMVWLAQTQKAGKRV
jgi:hypothetical protein